MTGTLIAVYGTLRTGHGNDRLWRGYATTAGLDKVDGYELLTYGAFPYAVPAEGGAQITVQLIEAEDDQEGADLLARLDRLEGTPNHYRRTRIVTESGRTAWMYVASDRTLADLQGESHRGPATVIDSGDWDEWCRAVGRGWR